MKKNSINFTLSAHLTRQLDRQTRWNVFASLSKWQSLKDLTKSTSLFKNISPHSFTLVCLSVFLFVCLSVRLSAFLSISLSLLITNIYCFKHILKLECHVSSSSLLTFFLSPFLPTSIELSRCLNHRSLIPLLLSVCMYVCMPFFLSFVRKHLQFQAYFKTRVSCFLLLLASLPPLSLPNSPY
jgi:hypothetical protein